MSDRPTAHAHLRVRDVAVAMAHELYDTMMHDNVWYDYWKKQHPSMNARQLEDVFVRKNLGRMLPQARATLAQMLRTSSDEKMKEEIYDALVKDDTLIKGRTQ